MGRSIIIALCAVLGVASSAAAQQQGAIQVVETGNAGTENAQTGRGLEYGGHILIPIYPSGIEFKDVAGTVDMNVGIGIQGRIGWEFGQGFAADLNLGGMVNTVQNNTDLSLTAGWFGGGVRYSVLNASAVVPFVGAGVQVNVWTAQYDSGGVIIESDSELTLGLNGIVGVIYEVSPYIGIEVGLQANLSFAGETFKGSVFWLSPAVGATIYY